MILDLLLVDSRALKLFSYLRWKPHELATFDNNGKLSLLLSVLSIFSHFNILYESILAILSLILVVHCDYVRWSFLLALSISVVLGDVLFIIKTHFSILFSFWPLRFHARFPLLRRALDYDLRDLKHQVIVCSCLLYLVKLPLIDLQGFVNLLQFVLLLRHCEQLAPYLWDAFELSRGFIIPDGQGTQATDRFADLRLIEEAGWSSSRYTIVIEANIYDSR